MATPTPTKAPTMTWINILPLPGSMYAKASETKIPLKSNAMVNKGIIIPASPLNFKPNHLYLRTGNCHA